MSVAMLEKDHWIGGGTALSHGGLWAGCNHIARRAGIPDSREAVIEYMRFVAGGEADNELLMAYVDSAPVALEYFERCGVGIRLLPGFPDHYFPVAPGSTEVGRSLESVPVSLRDLGELGDRIRDSEIDPHRASVSEFISWGGIVNRKNRDHALVTKREQDKVRTCGAALIAHFLKGLLRHNTTPFLETAAEELLERNGAITGILTNTGRQVKGRYGVVLAAGGYEGDAEMTRSFEGLPGWHSPFPKAIAGDAFRLATEVGAASAFTRNNLAVMVGVPVPSKVKGHEPEFRLVQIFECQMPHTIIVNAQGKRFSDEAYFQDTIAALRHYDVWKREYPNLPCYMLFDSQYVENFAFCGNDIGTPPPEWVTQADTLEELAGLLGISKSGTPCHCGGIQQQCTRRCRSGVPPGRKEVDASQVPGDTRDRDTQSRARSAGQGTLFWRPTVSRCLRPQRRHPHKFKWASAEYTRQTDPQPLCSREFRRPPGIWHRLPGRLFADRRDDLRVPMCGAS